MYDDGSFDVDDNDDGVDDDLENSNDADIDYNR